MALTGAPGQQSLRCISHPHVIKTNDAHVYFYLIGGGTEAHVYFYLIGGETEALKVKTLSNMSDTASIRHRS